jgi:uroporphyrinogen-III synthase
MPSLNGIRLALLEARRSSELSELVRRLGGEPYAVPAVREVPQLADVPAFLDALEAGRFTMVIGLTGAGISRLLVEAQGLDRIDATVAALRRAVTVCRGPKPSGVLRQYGIDVSIRAAEPYTTKELLDALSGIELHDRAVALVHYGERNEPLTGALRARGARLTELCVYEWQLPEDVGPLETLVEDLIGGRVQALAITSQIQCRHLFGIAAVMGRDEALAEALRTRVAVAAIGPVCVAALAAHGVTPQVVPAQSKMGALVTALAEYVDRRGASPAGS